MEVGLVDCRVLCETRFMFLTLLMTSFIHCQGTAKRLSQTLLRAEFPQIQFGFYELV